MDKASILASLTGDQPISSIDDKTHEAEQDLFGDLAVDEAPAHLVTSTLGIGGNLFPPETIQAENSTSVPVQTHQSGENNNPLYMNNAPVMPASTVPKQPVQQHSHASSLLSQSGLLGGGGGGEEKGNNSGGLFDDVDMDEEKDDNAKRITDEQINEVETVKNTETHAQNHEGQFQLNGQRSSMYDTRNPASQVPTGHVAKSFGDHSTNLQSVFTPHQQIEDQMGAMSLNNANQAGFYRQHDLSSTQNMAFSGSVQQNGNAGTGTQNSGNYFYGTREHQNQFSSKPVEHGYSGSFVQASSTVGMHNAAQTMNLGRIKKITLVKPHEVSPLYIDIRVTEPMLIQTQSFLISSPPYWSYQITSQLAGNQGTWLVRRRFRHVVALEDRLRQACPGSIIPPRPEKHATRALEEASTQQSAEFAVQRAKEIEQYLNEVARHPVAGQSQALRLFLGLQDDIGTAWPEVSANALTRLQAVGAGVTMRVAESTNLTAASAPVHEWEEDAELLGLCSSESLRLGAVTQAVPKLEGAVIVLREQGDAAGVLGMEVSKSAKTLDSEYKFLDVLSSGLLRHGRRTKRLALEMSAAMESFLQQYKLVRYEKMAMHDRRQAIQRKAKERGRADARAVHLSQQQRQLQVSGQIHHLSQLEQNAIAMDNQALDAVSEADEIGNRLKLEINRVAIDRRIAWNSSVKTIASSMKEACSERLAIWESTLESFENMTKNGGQF